MVTSHERKRMYRELTEERLQHLLPYSYRRLPDKLDRERWNPARPPSARQEHGIPAVNGELFVLTFEDSRSDWKQLVHLETDRRLEVEGVQYRKGVMLSYEPGRSVKFACYTKEGMLWVWNAWEYQDSQGSLRRLSHEQFSGMLVEEISNGYRYRCNEGRDDDDYDDLTFRIERTPVDVTARAKPTRD